MIRINKLAYSLLIGSPVPRSLTKNPLSQHIDYLRLPANLNDLQLRSQTKTESVNDGISDE